MVFCHTFCARGLSQLFLCSGTIQTTLVLKDCSDHCRARGLSRPLPCSGTASTTAVLGDCSVHCKKIALLGYM